MFDQETIELIGSYVYALSYPDNTAKYFYIGKGKGLRCFQHAKAAINETDTENLKLEIIKEIIKNGGQPHIYIIAHSMTEQEALRIEAVLIKVFPESCNAIQGHNSEDYWLTTDELNSRYAHPIYENDLGVRIALVSLNTVDPEKRTIMDKG